MEKNTRKKSIHPDSVCFVDVFSIHFEPPSLLFFYTMDSSMQNQIKYPIQCIELAENVKKFKELYGAQ